jgi:hypothetical protein
MVISPRGAGKGRAGIAATPGESVTQSGDWHEAHFNRAQVLSALGRAGEALLEYEATLAIEPQHLGALIFAPETPRVRCETSTVHLPKKTTPSLAATQTAF